METYTLATFLTDVSSTFSAIGDAIGVFMEPPLVWFVVFGAAAAFLGMAKTLIPRKRAR